MRALHSWNPEIISPLTKIVTQKTVVKNYFRENVFQLNSPRFETKKNTPAITRFKGQFENILVLCGDLERIIKYQNVIDFARQLNSKNIIVIDSNLNYCKIKPNSSINIEQSVKSKRLIFTVATGRCGTKFLNEIMHPLSQVASFHEPSPGFYKWLRSVQRHPEAAKIFWKEKKLPVISQIDQEIYLETSHLICKGFLEPLAELGYSFDLIFLKRPHREVARSMYYINSIPGRSYVGLKSNLSPEDPVGLPLGNWRQFNDYQLCYWYCLEMEHRAQKLRTKFQNKCNHQVSIDLETLTTERGFYDLLRNLEIEPENEVQEKFNKLKEKKVNNKKETKEKFSMDKLPGAKTLDTWEQEILQALPNQVDSGSRQSPEGATY
jgi:hypothetical protein